MRAIHIARKPVEGNTVRNILKWGTGGLHTDACRIKGGPEVKTPQSDINKRRGETGPDWKQANREAFLVAQRESVERTNTLGRWPANVILEHSEGCVHTGTAKVPGHKGYPNGPGGSSMHYSSDKTSEEVRPFSWGGHADEDGMETVEVWECQPNCPIAALDAQSGHTKGGRMVVGGPDRKASAHIGQLSGQPRGNTITSYGDTGAASRYFKQVQGK